MNEGCWSHLSIHPSIHSTTHPTIHPSTHPSIQPPSYSLTHLPTYPLKYPWFCPSVHPSIHLSIHSCIYPSLFNHSMTIYWGSIGNGIVVERVDNPESNSCSAISEVSLLAGCLPFALQSHCVDLCRWRQEPPCLLTSVWARLMEKMSRRWEGGRRPNLEPFPPSGVPQLKLTGLTMWPSPHNPFHLWVVGLSLSGKSTSIYLPQGTSISLMVFLCPDHAFKITLSLNFP